MSLNNPCDCCALCFAMPSAWIDRNQMDKVVVNLIDNAFKYTPNGGKITIAIVPKGKQKYSISVT